MPRKQDWRNDPDSFTEILSGLKLLRNQQIALAGRTQQNNWGGERRRRNRSRTGTRPTPAQKDQARRLALEAVASLQQGKMVAEASGGDSDHQTCSTDSDSHHSDRGPVVTLRTADDL
ncbi:hypothetical protein NDU88_003415 [Pleurodeles waltl]|uniref:Uncharacterized protein n=1 Tax=Pleurodeles waltl TaxID=8319 RepID=A0AAV7UYD7_PLEWA|nr:hypothetical protein NDU88_003415 [Pleurodeles waltl]